MTGTGGVTWLPECSAAAVGAALRAVAPALARYPVTVPGPAGHQDPVYQVGSSPLGQEFFVKFAWSEPAARRLAREVAVLTALGRDALVPHLPEIVACSTAPALLVTRRVPGRSLFAVIDATGPERAGHQLAGFLAALHHPAARERAEAAVGSAAAVGAEAAAGTLGGIAVPPATTATLRDRVGRWLRPDQRPAVRTWCDWADAVLAAPAPAVLVHGDLHGDNMVWDRANQVWDRANQGWDRANLRVVLDFETVGTADPEYDLRAFPGPGLGPGVGLLTATMRHYQHLTGRTLSADRVMAWHLRTALGDVLWRSEAGLPLPDHRPAPDWADDLAARFGALGIDPGRPRAAEGRATR